MMLKFFSLRSAVYSILLFVCFHSSSLLSFFYMVYVLSVLVRSGHHLELLHALFYFYNFTELLSFDFVQTGFGVHFNGNFFSRMLLMKNTQGSDAIYTDIRLKQKGRAPISLTNPKLAHEIGLTVTLLKKECARYWDLLISEKYYERYTGSEARGPSLQQFRDKLSCYRPPFMALCHNYNFHKLLQTFSQEYWELVEKRLSDHLERRDQLLKPREDFLRHKYEIWAKKPVTELDDTETEVLDRALFEHYGLIDPFYVEFKGLRFDKQDAYRKIEDGHYQDLRHLQYKLEDIRIRIHGSAEERRQAALFRVKNFNVPIYYERPDGPEHDEIQALVFSGDGLFDEYMRDLAFHPERIPGSKGPKTQAEVDEALHKKKRIHK
jgi:hypothetical protein